MSVVLMVSSMIFDTNGIRGVVLGASLLFVE